MQRFLSLTIAAATAVVTLSAGTIQTQIGGVNGLTGSYISSGCSTNVAGQTCVAGSDGTYVERSYDNRLFVTATEASTAPVPYAGYQMTAASTGTITDGANNDNFSMINDGCGSTAGGACTGGAFSNNIWAGQGAGTITVPIGIYDATQVWTMLNNIWGPAGAMDTNVIFTFGSSANATVGTTVVTLNLTNAGNTGTSGQIGTSVDCVTVTTPACTSYAIGNLSPSSNVGGVTVMTHNLFSTAYDTATGKFINSGGDVTLDDQGFIFGNAYANQYLVSIGVQELSGVGSTSQTALSAITVVSATPEPSTILLALAGFGAIGAARLRRRRS